jgi:hypothetical protein
MHELEDAGPGRQIGNRSLCQVPGALLLVASLLLLAGCPTEPPAPPADDDDSPEELASPGPYQFNTLGLGSIELSSSLGGARLLGELGRTTLEVTVVDSESGTLPTQLPATVIVEVEVVGSRLRAQVSGELPEGSPALDLVVLSPPSLPYSLNLDSGAAEVTEMSSTGEVRMETGTLFCSKLQGNLSVVIDEGQADIEAELPFWGSIDIVLGTGDIRLQIPADTSAQLEAIADDGSVYLLGLSLDGVHVEGQALGVLGAGEGSLSLLTSGAGDIQLEGISSE